MYLPPKFKGSPAIPSTNACSSVVFLLLFCRIAKAKALKKEVGLEVGPNRWWYKSDLVGTTQCPRTDLSKRFLPKPMTTTG